jgi:hypothetical protein
MKLLRSGVDIFSPCYFILWAGRISVKELNIRPVSFVAKRNAHGNGQLSILIIGKELYHGKVPY